MLQGWRNLGPKTAKKPATLTDFCCQQNLSLSLSLHRDVQPPTSSPPAWTPPSTSQATARTPHIVSAPPSLSPLQLFFFLHQQLTPATIPSTEAYWATSRTSLSQPSFHHRSASFPFPFFFFFFFFDGCSIVHVACFFSFKNTQKIFCFFSFSIWIMNLYVKHIPGIKKKVPFFIDVRTTRFLPDKIRTSLLRRTFLKS